jgi:hypothetical protein
VTKIGTIAGIVLLALIFLMIAQNALTDPLKKERTGLATALKEIPQETTVPEIPAPPFDTWHKTIMGKQALWSYLIPPPPPPPKAPPPKPVAKKISDLLAGVKPTRVQIGKKKIKIITNANPKGGFVEIGETLNECILEGFDKSGASFSYLSPETKETQKMTLPIGK